LAGSELANHCSASYSRVPGLVRRDMSPSGARVVPIRFKRIGSRLMVG
jgi:hypothetical protein